MVVSPIVSVGENVAVVTSMYVEVSEAVVEVDVVVNEVNVVKAVAVRLVVVLYIIAIVVVLQHTRLVFGILKKKNCLSYVGAGVRVTVNVVVTFGHMTLLTAPVL